MRAILMSIKPKWCELIASGKKTVEVRKTRPKLKTPFKVYIYCTKGEYSVYGNSKGYVTDHLNILNKDSGEGFEKTSNYHKWNGKVIGEFVCDKIIKFPYNSNGYGIKQEKILCTLSCVPTEELYHYLQGATPYAWHISNLVIYDKPKALSWFMNCKYPFECFFCDFYEAVTMSCDKPIRPPQSWCYVEVGD